MIEIIHNKPYKINFKGRKRRITGRSREGDKGLPKFVIAAYTAS